MNHRIVHDTGPILLVGGGECDNQALFRLLAMSKAVVGVDGGADVLHELDVVADAVIGDLDSISGPVRDAVPPDRLWHIGEQDSTDFDKALRHVSGPLILGAGFLGKRLDHQLAAMTVLVRRAFQRVVLVGADDVVLVAPPALTLNVPVGSRLSLYPLSEVKGTSTGLRWPIDGICFAPDRQVGTSNAVTGTVRLTFEGPGMLLILPATALSAVLAGLALCPGGWPAPGE